MAHLMGAGAWRRGCARRERLADSAGEERPGSGRLRGNHHRNFQIGALYAQQHTPWDHALEVTGDGAGLVGHAGAILLRKAADQAGLTAWLGAALQKTGKSPLFSRGIVLVSVAAAIALGATSMSDIAVLGHLSPVLGDAPSGPTVRRGLGPAGGAGLLGRRAKGRAEAPAHRWQLIEGTAPTIPRLA